MPIPTEHLWTLWFPALLGIAIVLCAIFADGIRTARKGSRRCPKCWYDMRGIAADKCSKFTCPECGRAAPSERDLHRPRRRWSWATIGALLALATLTPTAFQIRHYGWRAGIPTWALVRVISPASLRAPVAGTWDEKLARELIDRQNIRGEYLSPASISTILRRADTPSLLHTPWPNDVPPWGTWSKPHVLPGVYTETMGTNDLDLYFFASFSSQTFRAPLVIETRNGRNVAVFDIADIGGAKGSPKHFEYLLEIQDKGPLASLTTLDDSEALTAALRSSLSFVAELVDMDPSTGPGIGHRFILKLYGAKLPTAAPLAGMAEATLLDSQHRPIATTEIDFSTSSPAAPPNAFGPIVVTPTRFAPIAGTRQPIDEYLAGLTLRVVARPDFSWIEYGPMRTWSGSFEVRPADILETR